MLHNSANYTKLNNTAIDNKNNQIILICAEFISTLTLYMFLYAVI